MRVSTDDALFAPLKFVQKTTMRSIQSQCLILRWFLSVIFFSLSGTTLAMAAPLCATVFNQNEVTLQQITATIQELAKLKMNIDLEKTKGSTILTRDLKKKSQAIFEELSSNPQVGLTAEQIKLQIQNEIHRLQKDQLENAKSIDSARVKEQVLLNETPHTLPLATPEQLLAQEIKAKEILSRYDKDVIHIPFRKRFLAKTWSPKSTDEISKDLTARDLILKTLSEQTKLAWTRIEVIDDKGRVVGEGLWPIHEPRNFLPYQSALDTALGEAWANGNFFNVKKVNIVTITDLKDKISNYELNAAIQIKRWLEVMEFTDASVNTAVIFKMESNSLRPFDKFLTVNVTMNANMSAMKGDYKTDWNDFHQRDATFGEFAGPRAYSTHIHNGKAMWVRSRNHTELYEQLLQEYRHLFE